MKKRSPTYFTTETIRKIAESISTDANVLGGENFLVGRITDNMLNALIDVYSRRAAITLPLTSGETLAVAAHRPKTAALCFDRVWNMWEDIPSSIGFGWNHEDELLLITLFHLSSMASAHQESAPILSEDDPRILLLPAIAKAICRMYHHEYALPVVPVYESRLERDQEYQPGQFDIIATTFSNLDIVDENQLTCGERGRC